MTELKQHAWLLSIIGLLLLAKWVLVPIFHWQDIMIAETILLDKKKNKIDQVLTTNNDRLQFSEKLRSTLRQAESLFFPFENEANFKLTQQKMIEALLKKHKLISNNIGWQTSTQFSEISTIRYPLKLVFTGKSTDMIAFVIELESKVELIEIVDLNVSFKGQNEKQLGSVIGNVVINLFAKQQEPELIQGEK